MEYFNINAFILGSLLFACLYLSNIIFSLFCIYHKIKIIEFSLFFNPWFSLHNEKVMGTKFSLGWLPFGGFIKPLGMITDEEEKNKISQSDLPFAFFNKPKYLRTIFNLVPWFIYIFAFTLAFFLFTNFTDIIGEFKNVINYLIEAFTTMFSGNAEKGKFIITTKEVIADKNIVLFGFMLLTFVMLLFTPLTAIMNWFSNDKKNKSKIQKIFGFILTIGIFWLILWKIPIFIFSFFTFSQSLIYVISFFIGMFSIGLVCYFTTLFVIKNISQNLNDSKAK
ncbi:MAG: hypothetical protein WC319_01840 [Candidatus Paceibacterota bacterium]|jgi:hypothetical protein